MKIGTKVAVCYDGKWGRRVPGQVVGTKNGYKIRVRFCEWASEDPNTIEHWFKIKRRPSRWGGPRRYFAGYVPVEQPTVMTALFGMPGDYYAVYPWRDLE